jgi:hypothetical protein
MSLRTLVNRNKNLTKIFLNNNLKFSFKLRFINNIDKNNDWKTNTLFTQFPVLGPREEAENTGGAPGINI